MCACEREREEGKGAVGGGEGRCVEVGTCSELGVTLFCTQDFSGAQQLVELYLDGNVITSVAPEAFG